MTVLAFLLVIIIQVTDGVLRSWRDSDDKLKTFLTGRAVLESVSGDLENVICDTNLPNLGGSSVTNDFSFLTRREGLVSSGEVARPLSFVGYFVTASATNATLYRGETAYDWYARAFVATTRPAMAQTNRLCEGVISFQAAYSDTNGAFRPVFSSTNNSWPGEVRISVAVAGPWAYRRLQSMNLLGEMNDALNARAQAQTNSVLPAWEAWLESKDSKIPADLRDKIRFFERVYSIRKDALAQNPN